MRRASVCGFEVGRRNILGILRLRRRSALLAPAPKKSSLKYLMPLCIEENLIGLTNLTMFPSSPVSPMPDISRGISTPASSAFFLISKGTSKSRFLLLRRFNFGKRAVLMPARIDLEEPLISS